jgi:hypothetical protein
MRSALALSACLFFVAGCARGAPPVVVGGVPIEVVGRGDKLPIDTRFARLEAATKQLASIVGHPVHIQIDGALLPDWRPGLEEALARAVENVVRDLDALDKHEHEAFAYAAPKLRRIECRYEPTARRESATFDDGSGVARASMPADRGDLVPPGTIARALAAAYEHHVTSAFADKSPDDVPRGELAAYFDHITSKREGAQSEQPLAEHPRARAIANVVRVWELAERGSGLDARARDWLIDEGSFFQRGYALQADAVRAMPAASAWKRAEAAYVRFLSRAISSLDDDRELKMVRLLYGRESASAFPGFDRLAFGLSLADEWIRTGHPAVSTGGPRAALYEFVLCPAPRDKSGHHSISPRCDRIFYRDALATEAGRRKLADALTSRNDAAFTEAAFVALARLGARDALALWREVQSHAATWKIAAEIVLDEIAETADKGLVAEEAVRLWRDRADAHGVALALLAASDRYDNGAVAWKELPQRLGAPVEAADFASYLDADYRSISRASVVWPALSPGWSRADVIVPRLDRWLDEPRVREDDPQNPIRALLAIIQRMCNDGARADLAKVRAYLEGRQRSHPAERLLGLIDETQRCKPPRPGAPPAPRGTGPIGPPPPHTHL